MIEPESSDIPLAVSISITQIFVLKYYSPLKGAIVFWRKADSKARGGKEMSLEHRVLTKGKEVLKE